MLASIIKSPASWSIEDFCSLVAVVSSVKFLLRDGIWALSCKLSNEKPGSFLC